MTSRISVAHVTKTFGSRDVLTDVSLTADCGEIVGLIGPNGAGKTTLLSILAGLTVQTAGTVGYDFGVPNDQRHLQRIGFSSPELPLFDYLTAREVLAACGAVHGLGRDVSTARSQELLEFFELAATADRFLYEYSQGMRQKLSLCVALLHDPGLYLFDEPFDGLDSTACFRLAQLMSHLASVGRTIVVSSHDVGLVERLCHRIVILKSGTVVHLGDGLGVRGSTSTAVGSSVISPLERLMWEIVGQPEVRRLSWLTS